MNNNKNFLKDIRNVKISGDKKIKLAGKAKVGLLLRKNIII